MEKYEVLYILKQLYNILCDRQLLRDALEKAFDWLTDYGCEVGIDIRRDFEEFWNKEGYFNIPRRFESLGFAALSNKLLHLLSQEIKRLEMSPLSRLEQNLRSLSSEMGLADVDRELLGMICRYQSYKPYQKLFDKVSRVWNEQEVLLGAMTGHPHRDVVQSLRKGGRLLTSRLVIKRSYSSFGDMPYEIPEQMTIALRNANGGIEELRSLFLGKPVLPSLRWSDFSYMGDKRERITEFIKEAVSKNMPGVNILLYGPPGTGKTEFCRALAKHLKFSLYAVCEADDNCEEPTRSERMSSLVVSQAMLKDQAGVLMLVDEMEDFLVESVSSLFSIKRHSASKVFMNRTLENNPVPTIWIINDPELLEESVVRRMAFALEMCAPPLKARVNLWKRVLRKHKVSLPEKEIRALASQDNISPAIVENVVRFGSLTDGSIENIRFAINSIVQVVNPSGSEASQKSDKVFLPSLVKSDLKAESLVKGLLKEGGANSFSLCLYGPPGTGKSAFAKNLAEELGLSVLMKRASDIFGPYVGMTEKNIAMMFRQAVQEESLLILDEADSLLQDRRGAHRSWEVSQVNEMLTWMERHPLPFVCTTNLMSSLDQASLRRFTFKVRFDFLGPAQIETAFVHFFNCQPPKGFEFTKGLTPGDFSVVAKRAKILGSLEDSQALADMLKAEVSCKDVGSDAIGFTQ